MVTISHFHTLPPIILPTFRKGHTSHHQTQTVNRAFGYLSVILAPFGTVFGYFWFNKSGNPYYACMSVVNEKSCSESSVTMLI